MVGSAISSDTRTRMYLFWVTGRLPLEGSYCTVITVVILAIIIIIVIIKFFLVRRTMIDIEYPVVLRDPFFPARLKQQNNYPTLVVVTLFIR